MGALEEKQGAGAGQIKLGHTNGFGAARASGVTRELAAARKTEEGDTAEMVWSGGTGTGMRGLACLGLVADCVALVLHAQYPPAAAFVDFQLEVLSPAIVAEGMLGAHCREVLARDIRETDSAPRFAGG